MAVGCSSRLNRQATERGSHGHCDTLNTSSSDSVQTHSKKSHGPLGIPRYEP